MLLCAKACPRLQATGGDASRHQAFTAAGVGKDVSFLDLQLDWKENPV